MLRVATMAGGRAVARVKTVQAAVEARDRPLTDAEMEAAPRIGAGTMREIDRKAEHAAMEAAITTFEAWLARKLGCGLAALRP